MDRWLRILDGLQFALGHGYYVTKQPSQRDLENGTGHEAARDAENAFFKATPWNNAPLSTYKKRYGTLNLQAKLGELLVADIRQSIPQIREQIDLKVLELTDRLAAMPEPPGARSFAFVSDIMSQLQIEVGRYMQGELPYHSFIDSWRSRCEDFKKTLYNLRPTLIIKTSAERKQMVQNRAATSFSTVEHIDLAADDDDEDTKTPTNRKRPAPGPSTPSPSKRQRPQTQHASFSTARSSSQTSHSPYFLDLYTYTRSHSPGLGHVNRFGIEDIQTILKEVNTSAIMGTTDHRAVESIIERTMKAWPDALDGFINSVAADLETRICHTIDGLLAPWSTTPLSQEVPRLTRQFMSNLVSRPARPVSSFSDLCSRSPSIASVPNTFLRQKWTSPRRSTKPLHRPAETR